MLNSEDKKVKPHLTLNVEAHKIKDLDRSFVTVRGQNPFLTKTAEKICVQF